MRKNKKRLAKPQQKVGFRVEIAPSGKWGVWLAINQYPEMVISVHLDRKDAVHGANQCRACLAVCRQLPWGKNIDYSPYKNWAQKFLMRLLQEFDYADDDSPRVATPEEFKAIRENSDAVFLK